MLSFSPKKRAYEYNSGYGHARINEGINITNIVAQQSKFSKSTILETKRDMDHISLPKIMTGNHLISHKKVISIPKKSTLLFRHGTSHRN